MFTPHTDAEKEAMLHTVGITNIEELFKDVPAEFRFPKLDLPPARTEMEVMAEIDAIAQSNVTTREFSCFLGAGAYHHYIPAAVDSLLRRGEFWHIITGALRMA